MTDTRDFFTAVPRSEFETPGTSRGLVDVVRWRYLLNLLVRTGVTTRYRNSVLGWTWSYVRPAAQFLVFWVVLGLFMNLDRGIPNYAVYLFSGIVVINLFSEAFKNATTSIVGNAPLVRKVFLPRQLFAVSAVIVAFVHFLPQVGLLLVVCLLLGWIVNVSLLSILAILAGMLIVMLFALGLGLFFGAINVRFRDAENIVELLLLLATWASPVLYAWTQVQDAVVDKLGWPQWLVEVYMLNPITQGVELFHYAFWRPVTDTALQLPPGLAWNTLWTFLIAVGTLLFGQFVFRRLEGRFAQDL
ncbi:ABC-2 type transport system permease protein [Microbacterium phyllosphaerae]|uniref:Transport permease protein n=1 Tax=Microbacterium phyllosphaerae TaxID=124798 RepID=A0ABS4WPZ9_9MICO|nr:ABC transporter permease [Microbacterium phyllosphaerae]MBP2378272.1 ABC-2 type transport system permease protein [Microbacterium phyllosphaerae]